MKYTYITYLSDDRYFQGTLGLIGSLRAVRSKYPLLIMINKFGEVSENIIAYLHSLNNVLIKLIDPIVVDDNILKKNKDGNQTKWTNTFSKLRMFEFDEYDKIIFLDSDMLIVDNIDNLFERDHMSAVSADAEYPGNNYRELNSGLLVVIPEKDEGKKLMNLIPTITDKPIGDQDILHLGFPSWHDMQNLHLSSEYNVFVNHIDYYRKHVWRKTGEKEKVIHFVGPQKPWQMGTTQIGMFILKKTIWWRPNTIKYFVMYRKLIHNEMRKYLIFK